MSGDVKLTLRGRERQERVEQKEEDRHRDKGSQHREREKEETVGAGGEVTGPSAAGSPELNRVSPRARGLEREHHSGGCVGGAQKHRVPLPPWAPLKSSPLGFSDRTSK